MVDSITPATDDALRARAEHHRRRSTPWPIQREPFTQWVVEDVPAMRDADWQSVGVTLAKDVGVYDRAKLRLLNGPHSTLAYLGPAARPRVRGATRCATSSSRNSSNCS